MSKYITHFQTEAEYQTALPTLDLPNVSLVDELGEVHYHRALYGAHAGDIALYDVANAQKIVVTKDDWNLTTYPTANYPIIGVVIADESATGCKVVSLIYINSDGTKTETSAKKGWQNTNFDWGLTKYNTDADAKTDMNGKANTTAILAAIKSYDLANGTDNITGNYSQGIQLYSTAGTLAGDWYIPSSGEMYTLLTTNRSVINSTITKIHNANSSLCTSIYSSAKHIQSTEYGVTAFAVTYNGSYDAHMFTSLSKNNDNTDVYCRPFAII